MPLLSPQSASSRVELIRRARRCLLIVDTDDTSARFQRWPDIPPSTFFGFCIGRRRGVIWARSPIEFGYIGHMINDAGQYFCVKVSPEISPSGRQRQLSENSHAYFVTVEPQCSCEQSAEITGSLSSRTPQDGDHVFAIGKVHNLWTVTEGRIIDSRPSEPWLTTTCECYHGYCGGPLLDANGDVIGFGASIRMDNSPNEDGVPVRKYGLSYFDRLSDGVG
jgi:hypothetical protein